MKFRRNTEAVESFDKALEIDPNLAYLWMNRGNALDYSGKYVALEIAIDPWVAAQVWNNIGVCFHNLGRYKEGIKHYDKALEIERYDRSVR
jgi:tetratricopeptide (TPR) repeat protein